MRILKKHNPEDILFLDIETAHGDNNFSEESPMFDAWEYDQLKNAEDGNLIDLYFNRAALSAEYGKIVCITIGAIRDGKPILKSFYGEERELLEEFNKSLDKFITNKTYLCGHAVIGFDVPYIMRRCLVNSIELHSCIDIAHLKPWEVKVFDTMTLWRSTGFRTSSLISVASALGLPSPKDDISGKDVGKVFYEGGVDRIVQYCEKDVLTVINIVRVLRGESVLEIPVEVAVVKEEPKGILTRLHEGCKYGKEEKELLKEKLKSMGVRDRKIAIEILNTIPTRAKGKQTNITKKDIKELEI